MAEVAPRKRGRPVTTGGHPKRTIRLPPDLADRWDNATTEQVRAALDRGLPA